MEQKAPFATYLFLQTVVVLLRFVSYARVYVQIHPQQNYAQS